MSPERSEFFNSDNAHIVATVDAGVGHNQLVPAWLDEGGQRIDGHLAGVVGVHAAQRLDGVEHVLGGGRSSQLECAQEFWCVAAQGGVALADAVQEDEVIRLRELLRFGDTLGEGIPGYDALDGGERGTAHCLASISAWPMRPYRRTLALMALPDAWNCC